MEWNETYKILLALILGGLIGFERQYRAKAAGFRTIIIICMGTTLFTMLSSRFGWGDPSRIAAGIVTGIGFLGAGAIIRNEGFISGLTTAATIWFIAAVGISIGLGYYELSIFSVLVILVVLIILPYFEKIIEKFADIITIEMELSELSYETNNLINLVKQKKLKIINLTKEKSENNLVIKLKIKGKQKRTNLLIDELIKNDFIFKLKIR